MLVNAVGDRAAQHVGDRADDRDPATSVVDRDRDPRLLDDRAEHAAARCSSASLVAASMDPLGVWIAHLRGFPVPSLLEHARPLSAQLRLRGRRDRAVDGFCSGSAGGCARRRSWAATGSSSCSATAAWARSGARSTGCSRGDAAIKLVRPEVLGAGSDDEAKLHAAPVRARGAGHGGAQLAAHDSALRLRR